MLCKKCGKSISDGASVCENCGAEASSEEIENTAAYTENVQETACADKTEEVTEEETAQKTAQTSLKDEQKTDAQASEKKKVRSEISKKKRRLKKSTIIIGVASAVLCIALIILTFPYIRNTFAKLFLSSEDYFAYVVKSNAKDSAEGLANTLDNLKSSALNGSSATGSADIALEEPFHNVLSDVTSDVKIDIPFIDLSVESIVGWIDEISVDYELKGDGKNQQSVFKLDVNDTKFGEIDVVKEKETGVTYLGFPDYNDVYFALNQDENDADTYGKLTQSSEKVITALPGKELTEKIIVKYVECFAENVGEVKESGKSVEAGKFSKRVTSLTTEISRDEMESITEKLLDEIEKDKRIQNAVKEYAQAADMSEDDVMKNIEEAVNEINRFYSEDLNGDVALEIYVDAKGEIIGMKLSDGKLEFSNCTITKWFEIGNEISGRIDDVSFSLEGNGKLSDNKVKLDYTLDVMDSHMADISIYDLDYKKMKDGLYDARAKVTFDEEAEKAGEKLFKSENKESVAAKLFKVLPEISAEIAVSQEDSDKTQLSVTINHKDELCAVVDINNSSGEKKKVDIPKEQVGTNWINAGIWVSSFDDSSFFDFLNDAGAPNAKLLEFGYSALKKGIMSGVGYGLGLLFG